jgi:GNAT superfamily N-acetyltransferase
MPKISLRPIAQEDLLFSYRVYASTRAEEMELVDWGPEQIEAFLEMQFNAQAEHYRLHYPTAEYQLILKEGKPVGRLITERSQDQLLIMDISILPEYRRGGIGTELIQDLMHEASHSGVPLALRVEFFNPVIRLYTRLGFVKTREVNSVYHEMVWKPTRSLVQPDLESAVIELER